MSGGKVGVFQRSKARLKDHFAEYGGIAIVTYFVIFALTWIGFTIAIREGVSVEGVAGETGSIWAAYVAAKLTQPIRIVATLAITPIVAMGWHRLRGRAPAEIAAAKPVEAALPAAEDRDA
jgi:hypothetical protein